MVEANEEKAEGSEAAAMIWDGRPYQLELFADLPRLHVMKRAEGLNFNALDGARTRLDECEAERDLETVVIVTYNTGGCQCSIYGKNATVAQAVWMLVRGIDIYNKNPLE